MTECSVKHCTSKTYSSGLCSKHYNRLRTTGTTDDGPRSRGSLEDRFWKYVRKAGSDDCWPWIGKSKVSGYGVIGLGGRGARKILAHRLAYTLVNGALPETDGYHGAVVRHKCNNRACCNPAHLDIGTQADNVADMWASSGKRGNAKLTEKQVRDILRDRRSSRQLAPLYGVSDAHVRNIRQGKAWQAK